MTIDKGQSYHHRKSMDMIFLNSKNSKMQKALDKGKKESL